MAKKGQSKYMSHMRAKAAAKVVRNPHIGTKHDFSDHRIKEATPGKGKHGQNCNVTACQRPNSAWWWNSSTRAWYCCDCAYDIQKANWRDAWWVQNYDYTLLTPPGEQHYILDLEGVDPAAPKRFAFNKPNGMRDYFDTVEEAAAAMESWCINAGLEADGEHPHWYQNQLVALRTLSGKPYVDFVGNRP